jgi:hypothetical protein
MGYEPLPITPRNTDATRRVRSPFAFAGSNIVRVTVALNHQSDSSFRNRAKFF